KSGRDPGSGDRAIGVPGDAQATKTEDQPAERDRGAARPARSALVIINRREPVKLFRMLSVTGALALAGVMPALAVDISGAGATFPYPIYAKWADAYKKETGVGLNYQSIGSGGGIKQIQAKTVTFGATDAPLSGADLDKDALVQFPMVMGGIVPVVNLDG